MNEHIEPAEPLEGESVASPRVQQEIALLKKAIGTGFDVEAFMGSDIGRYLQMRANREMEEAQDALILVDPCDANAIRALQMKAHVAQKVLSYLGDAVTEGENAERQLQAAFDSQRTPD